jgi:hypothetical protein
MAQLSSDDRARIWRGLMRYWSSLRQIIGMRKSDLLAAINATDTWIDDNAASYNNALPTTAKNNLTADQKTLLFCAVALMRVDPGLAVLLRRALGVEVD